MNLGSRPGVPVRAVCCLSFLVCVIVGTTGCGETPQVEAGGTVEEAARDWVDATRPLESGLADAVLAHTAFTRQMVGKWDTDRKAMLRPATDVHRRFQRLLAQARALPAGSREINTANATFVRGFSHAVKAYDKYLVGLKSGQFERMEAGDENWSKAVLEFSRVRPLLDDVIGKPASDFEREVREVTTTVQPVLGPQADTALQTNSDMIDALERGQWEAARKKSGAAGRQFRAIVRRLEDVPKPDDERLAAFLDSSIRGYRLMADAFVDYDRGLAARDTTVLAAGDRKFQRGFILTQKASAGLVKATRPTQSD